MYIKATLWSKAQNICDPHQGRNSSQFLSETRYIGLKVN